MVKNDAPLLFCFGFSFMNVIESMNFYTFRVNLPMCGHGLWSVLQSSFLHMRSTSYLLFRVYKKLPCPQLNPPSVLFHTIQKFHSILFFIPCSLSWWKCNFLLNYTQGKTWISASLVLCCGERNRLISRVQTPNISKGLLWNSFSFSCWI